MKRIKKKYKILFVVLLLVSILISTLFKTNEVLRPQLMAIAKQKTNNAISLLCQKVLGKLDYKMEDMVDYEYSKEGKIISIQYNTKKMNEILETSLQTIDASLEAAVKGEEDPLLKEVLYEDGIIYSVPIGYLTRISFLQDYGFKFDIGMRIFHYINGDIDIETKPYGINSTLVSIQLQLSIEAEAITALYSEKIHFHEEIPLVLQVIEGDIPRYMNTKKE